MEIKINRPADGGVTLVEVVIASVMLLFVVFASMSYFYFGAEQRMEARRHEYALLLGENRMEEFRAVSQLAHMADLAADDSFSRYGVQFNRYFSASDPEWSSTGERYQVLTVTVAWTRDGNDRSIAIRSIVSPAFD